MVVGKWCEGVVARMSVAMRSYVGGGAPRSARVDLGDELQNFVAGIQAMVVEVEKMEEMEVMGEEDLRMDESECEEMWNRLVLIYRNMAEGREVMQVAARLVMVGEWWRRKVQGPARVGLMEETERHIVEVDRAQVPQILTEKMQFVAEVWQRGLSMRDRFRGFLRWRRKVKKANPDFKKKKKRKKKRVHGPLTGTEGSAAQSNDQWGANVNELWEIQTGVEGAVEFYERRALCKGVVHWATRTAITKQRQEQAADKYAKAEAKLQRDWEELGGMPQPRGSGSAGSSVVRREVMEEQAAVGYQSARKGTADKKSTVNAIEQEILKDEGMMGWVEATTNGDGDKQELLQVIAEDIWFEMMEQSQGMHDAVMDAKQKMALG